MLRVSLVGHSQVPRHFEIEGVEIRIFRAPGGRAESLLTDCRTQDVLNWEHDLCILWIGSNDIRINVTPQDIFKHIQTVVREIEEQCGAEVIVVQIEPRIYPETFRITTEDYVKFQNSINRKIKRNLNNQNLHFNNLKFQYTLADDGVHWNAEGKEAIKGKFRKCILSRRDV